jgi:hypothetical protein
MDGDVITISFDDICVDAELGTSATAAKILEALPFEGTVNTWGQEIYFTIPVTVQQGPDARAEVDIGEIAFWPMGRAFCIFFGPTPVSRDEKPRAYSPQTAHESASAANRADKSAGRFTHSEALEKPATDASKTPVMAILIPFIRFTDAE